MNEELKCNYQSANRAREFGRNPSDVYVDDDGMTVCEWRTDKFYCVIVFEEPGRIIWAYSYRHGLRSSGIGEEIPQDLIERIENEKRNRE